MGHQSRLKRERKQAAAQTKALLSRLSDVHLAEMFHAFMGADPYVQQVLAWEVARRAEAVIPKGQNVGVSEVVA
jgi:hypothetical protein